MAEVSEPHLHHNEQGIKVLFDKRYRWTRESRTSPLSLVRVPDPEPEPPIEIPQAVIVKKESS